MHIGVDATCWQLARGFGRHTRCLLTALREVDRTNRYTFFTDAPGAAETLSELAEVRLVRTSIPTVLGASADQGRRLADLVAMSRAMADRSIDLLLFPTTFSYVPVFSRARKLMMIHDVTAERFPSLTLGGRRARLLWSIKASLARWQADAIATVSEYSRKQLAAEFGLDQSRIHVVGEAADPVFRRLEHPRLSEGLNAAGVRQGRRYVVYVGGFSPHKNLLPLVDAFGQLVEDASASDVDLVLVGDYRRETFLTCYEDVRRRVSELRLESRVVFAGFVPDEDLVSLLNLATVLVLPTLMEGFGLPALEAAACGCPVIATIESPLPGLLGDAAVYIDPRAPASIADALRLVVRSPERRDEMRRGGLEASARLTWTAAARELVMVMEQVAAS
jgi:glycosyltransferase involved in cell wall biosynthesis